MATDIPLELLRHRCSMLFVISLWNEPTWNAGNKSRQQAPFVFTRIRLAANPTANGMAFNATRTTHSNSTSADYNQCSQRRLTPCQLKLLVTAAATCRLRTRNQYASTPKQRNTVPAGHVHNLLINNSYKIKVGDRGSPSSTPSRKNFTVVALETWA